MRDIGCPPCPPSGSSPEWRPGLVEAVFAVHCSGGVADLRGYTVDFFQVLLQVLKLLLPIKAKFFEQLEQLLVEVAAISSKSESIKGLGDNVTQAVQHLLHFVRDEAKPLRAQNPHKREDDPDRKEGVHCQPQGQQRFLRFRSLRQCHQALILRSEAVRPSQRLQSRKHSQRCPYLTTVMNRA
eukprot:1633325-Rhodomonas_salina.2